jgi:hypothetical protein
MNLSTPTVFHAQWVNYQIWCWYWHWYLVQCTLFIAPSTHTSPRHSHTQNYQSSHTWATSTSSRLQLRACCRGPDPGSARVQPNSHPPTRPCPSAQQRQQTHSRSTRTTSRSSATHAATAFCTAASTMRPLSSPNDNASDGSTTDSPVSVPLPPIAPLPRPLISSSRCRTRPLYPN